MTSLAASWVWICDLSPLLTCQVPRDSPQLADAAMGCSQAACRCLPHREEVQLEDGSRAWDMKVLCERKRK
eukprot:5464132-Amphidinium_carterae.1